MTQTFELIGGMIIGTIAYFAIKSLLTPTVKDIDSEIFWRWCHKQNRKPSIDQEEHFLETVAKLSAEGHPDGYCRREAYKRVIGLPAPHI